MERALWYKNSCSSTHPARSLRSWYRRIEFFASYAGYAKEEGGIGWAAGGRWVAEGWNGKRVGKLSRRLSVDITVESARYGTSKKEKQGKGIERNT